MTDAKSLYDQDFVAWTEQQAEALRSAARGGANQALDWDNLAEEVQSLGASERRELHSQIQRIIRHLLKIEHSPALDPRPGRAETIDDARSEVELVLEMSPSLTNEIGAAVEAEMQRGSRRAIRDLQKYGEIDPLTEQALRAARYTVDQVLGDWFPPDPTGVSRGDG